MMKKAILFALMSTFLTIGASGCVPVSAPVPISVPSTVTPEPTATTTITDSSWNRYTNERWGFSVVHPTAWAISNDTGDAGNIGKQVYWWVGNDNPLHRLGDAPVVNQMTEVEIDGYPAIRLVGHYQGALGDMGHQQYLRYMIQKGDLFYMFALFAVDARGLPSGIMNETRLLREDDVTIFEQMMATVKFK